MSLFPDLKANTNSNKFHLDLKSKITPVMQQWFYLKNKYSECILFFRMGDFYELFFDDAIKVAPILDLKLTTRGIDHNKKPIPLAGIPAKSLKYYLQKIIDKNIPVAVVEQDSKPITIKGKEFFPRDVTQVITPGTILDPDLISSKSNNYLMLINYKNKNNWGWAVCDVSTGEFNIAKFTSFQDLNNEAFKLKPSEILLNSSIQNNKEFLEEFKKIFPELTLNFLEPNLFEYDNTINNLYSHFNVNSLEGFGINEIDYVVGIESAGALLKTLNHRKIPFIASRLVTYSNTNYLEIDHIARKNLELDQNLRDGKLQGTLLSILDKTSTSMGARTLRSWFRKPLVEIKQINDRLDVVELFFKEYSLREDLIECFQQITDLERICTKIFYKGASPRDLKRLEESLLVLPVVVGILGSIPHSTKMNLMNTINSNITSIPEAINIINSALKADATIIQDGNFIKDNFSFDLDKLRDLKRNSKKILLEFEKKEQEKINDLARQNNVKEPKLKVAYTRGHGYYIEVSKAQAGKVPTHYTRRQTLKNAERFITDELKGYEEKVLSAREKSLNREKALYEDLLETLSSHLPSLQIFSRAIAEID
ncbi:MAG: DNA mismatch repair protein MutS, partial [Candidatus Heimdallarchaeota archaeon]